MNHSNLQKPISRRDLLRGTAATAAVSMFSPDYAKAAKLLPASERVNVAFIGIGGKGINNRVSLQRTGMCNVVALCDVDLEGPRTLPARVANGDAPRPEGVKESDYGTIEPKAPYFTDFRDLFDKIGNQIDAVIVSTPDHTHFPAAMLAMSLGKHVWVEKPLAHSFDECERLVEMADRSGVVTQMGNQGHSSANVTQFKAWTEAGVIKDVTRIIAHMNKGRAWHGWGAKVTEYPSQPKPEGLDWETWTGPALMNSYSEKLHPGRWRGWFDYGCGALGDWGPHILDTCHRFLKLGLPESITAVNREGINPYIYPQVSTLCFQFPEREGMPACEILWYDGVRNAPKLEPEFDKLDRMRPGKAIYSKSMCFQGESHTSTLRVVSDDRESKDALPAYETNVPNHWHNFLLACKGQAEASSPFHISAPLTQVLNLGMICQRLGGTLDFDRETKRFTNNEEASQLLAPAPRAGWEEFYRL